MPPVTFEPTISAGERPQTYTLDRTATGTGTITLWLLQLQPYLVCKISYCSYFLYKLLKPKMFIEQKSFSYLYWGTLTLRRQMSHIYIYIYIYIYMEHPFLMFLDHTQRRSTVGRTPLGSNPTGGMDICLL